jgi:adenylylsulfate kinase
MSGMVLWITGLPGSGKSSVADAVKERYPAFVVLRMDDLRKFVTPEPTYSDGERDLVYRSLIAMAKNLSDLNHEVIIDATGNMRRWRELARETIPLFAEVYLTCSLETCRQREQQRTETHGAPRGIYAKGAEGAPVPGVNVAYEEPLNPEIVIDVEKVSVVDAAKRIARFAERVRKNG